MKMLCASIWSWIVTHISDSVPYIAGIIHAICKSEHFGAVSVDIPAKYLSAKVEM